MPEAFAESFVDADKGIADVRAALDGARAILMEAIAEDAQLVGELRDWLWAQGQIRAKVVEARRTRARSSATTSITSNRSARFPRTACLR